MLKDLSVHDFVGLDEKAANGLIQTEVTKRMNINTKRTFKDFSYLGLLSWIEPSITLSKIEQKNRNLALNQAAPMGLTASKKYYANTLDIRKYESLSVGVRFNAFYLDFPQIKSTFLFNGNLFYGRTPFAADSITGGVNTVTLAPDIACDIRADERWGLSLQWRASYLRARSRELVQVADLLDVGNKVSNSIRNNWYNTAQFQAFFQPSEDNRGRLFFRYRFHWQYGDQNLNFHQAQLGYSFYLLGRNKGTVKK